jgi:hypothetical protein
MKTSIIIVSAFIALFNAGVAYSAPPVNAKPKPFIVGGVDINAVDWAKLCSALKPISFTRAGVTCETVSPTSGVLQVWQDWGNTGEPAPPPSCEFESTWFARVTRAPWSICKQDFIRALKDREGTRVNYDDMSLDEYRAKYFPASVLMKGE